MSIRKTLGSVLAVRDIDDLSGNRVQRSSLWLVGQHRQVALSQRMFHVEKE